MADARIDSFSANDSRISQSESHGDFTKASQHEFSVSKSAPSLQRVVLPPMPIDVEQKSRSDLIQPDIIERDVIAEGQQRRGQLPPIDMKKVEEMEKAYALKQKQAKDSKDSPRLPRDRVFANRTHRPDNAWGYDGPRYNLQHLLENSVCQCGTAFGFSYLAERRKKVNDDSVSISRPIQTFDHLDPESLTFVSYPASCATHLKASQYTIEYMDHPFHETVFPTLRPTNDEQVKIMEKKFDVLSAQIQSTLQNIDLGHYTSNAACAGDSPYEFDSAPFMEGFISLVREEQNLYNECMHELLRQVTVECAERGALMAKVRKACVHLLADAPSRVMPYYEELLAQRVFARHIESELRNHKEEMSRLTEENALFSLKLVEMQARSSRSEESKAFLETCIQHQQETLHQAETSEEARRSQLETELFHSRQERRKRFEKNDQEKESAEEEITVTELRDRESKLYKTATELAGFTIDVTKQFLIYFSSSHENFKGIFMQYSSDIIDLVLSSFEKMNNLLSEFKELKQSANSGEKVRSAKIRYSTSRWREFLDDINTSLHKASLETEKNQEQNYELLAKWRTAGYDLIGRIVDPPKKQAHTEEMYNAEKLITDWLQNPILHSFDKLRETIIYLASELKSYIDHLSSGKHDNWPEFLSLPEVAEIQERVNDWIKYGSEILDTFSPLVLVDPKTQLGKLSRVIDNLRLNLRGCVNQQNEELENILAVIHGRLEAWTERLTSLKGFEIPSQIAELKSIHEQVTAWISSISMLISKKEADAKKENNLLQMELNELVEELKQWMKSSIQYTRLLEMKEEEKNPEDPFMSESVLE